MKRDMDLIRKILFHIEESNELDTRNIDISGYEKNIVDYHIKLLNEAKLLNADILPPERGTIFIRTIGGLTWQGHDFLDAARNENV